MREDIARWVAADRESAVAVLGADAESRIAADTEKNYSRYDRMSSKIIQNFVQFLKAY